MNILVVNYSLNKLGGTETFTYTLIEELVKRNHKVAYFTLHRGFVSQKIEKELGVCFSNKKKYDLVLANHNRTVKKTYFKGFTIQTCHGVFPELEQPSHYADAHVAISTEVQNHLADLGFSSRLIYNGINCDRYKIKKAINAKLTSVLSLCHSDSANNKLLNITKSINVELIVADKYNEPIWNVEDLINKVDLVVGLGRSAYEAMSCGRPVIIWDDREYFNSVGDGYVKEKLAFSILNNCSGRYSNKTYTEEELYIEFKKYNANDTDFFRNFAIENLNIVKAVDQYLAYYKKLTEEKSDKKFREKIEKFIGKYLLNKIGFLKSKFRRIKY